MIPPKARAGNTGRPTLSESIHFVSDRPVGSNKAVTQIARNAKSTPFVTGRRVTDETGKKNGGCPWAAWAAAEGRRLDQWIGCVLYRLNAGSLTAIPSATHLSDNHLLPPPIYQLKGVTKLKSIPSLSSQPSPWKEIEYSVVIRTRLIIFRFSGITQHLNYCVSFSPSKFQLFEDSWIYCVFIKN